MNIANLDRWQAVCKVCGFAGRLQDYRRVIRAWSSRGRRYHTLKHLEACLQEFDAVRHLALHPGEVELALWFHDAVYSTWRSDNEARSVELAGEIMVSGGAQSPIIQRVKAAMGGIPLVPHSSTGRRQIQCPGSPSLAAHAWDPPIHLSLHWPGLAMSSRVLCVDG
jgi:hypothetical protein